MNICKKELLQYSKSMFNIVINTCDLRLYIYMNTKNIDLIIT